MGAGIALSTAPLYLEPSGDLPVDNNTRFDIFEKIFQSTFFISGPNLKKLGVFLIKDHDTESNAFSKSINNNNPGIFLFSV